MRNGMRVLMLGSSLLLTSCAHRIAAPAGAPGVPRVGWVLMHGDRDNPDREFSCQSIAPGDCVLPASRPNAQVFAALYLYYHSAPTDLKYSGTVQIGFLTGAEPHELRPNVTVKAKGEPGNQSVTGIASDRPGTYPLTIAVDAAPIPSGAVRQIREQIRVTVR